MGLDPAKLPKFLQDKLKAAGHGDMIAKAKRRNASPEADLQRDVAKLLDVELTPRNIWWSSTLNGVRLRTAKARGQARDQGLRPGLPDFVIVPLGMRGEQSIFFIELKVGKNKATAEQGAILDAVGPGAMAVCRSVAEVRKALQAWGLLL